MRFRASPLLAILVLLGGTTVAPVPAVAGAPSTVRLVVTFRTGTPDATANRVARGGGAVVERIDQLRVRVVEVPAAAAERVRTGWAANPHVQQVETDSLMAATWIPPDPLWTAQWEHRQVRGPRAWDLERGTFKTVVAVVDTGVQLTHPDLSRRLVAGYDFVNRDSRPADDNGHGTAVAGVVAATANSIGVAGMCARCMIMPVKALNADGIGYWTVAAKAIIWAADHHADVINLSFGGPAGGTTLGNAIAYARSKGVVVVAAAGNFGSQSRFYPAAYSGVISVAASTDYDLRYSWSDYSTSWVDVAAPGCTWATRRGGGYGSFCGTSAATPIVSGIAGLLDSARPGITRLQIESILTGTTIRTPWLFTRFGRVDAYRAVYRAIHGTVPPETSLKPATPLKNDDVTLAAGNHEGYRFDLGGAMIRGRPLSLSIDTAVHTSKRSRIPGRSGYWFYLTDGGLGGWWVHESSTAFLTPDPAPTPTPRPSPTPTPTH